MLEKVASGVFLLRGWASFDDISSNCYFLKHGRELLLIDCGNASGRTAADLKAAAKELGGSVARVYCTHGHADHAGGAKHVKALDAETPVFLDEKDFFLIPEADRKRFTPLKDNEENKASKVVFGGFELRVLATPGHSPGSVCFFDEKRKILFSGDALFAAGAHGRTDFPGGNEREMVKSLSLIKKLGWRTLCPGHDEVERA